MKQGEVWQVDFAPAIGQEINKQRPAIIVNSNAIGKLKLKIVVPVSDVSVPALWHRLLNPSQANGLSKPSYADCFQMKPISENRFIRRLGELSQAEIDEIKIGMALVLDLY